MKIDFTAKAIDGIDELPVAVKKAFYKQVRFLEALIRDAYLILEVIPHPK